MRTGHKKGIDAEKWAALYLRLKGYGIIGMRYRTPLGEIDIIAKRFGTVVFAEVKMRKSKDDGAAAIHIHNQRRVRRAAELYLQKHPEYTGLDMRFDAVIMSPRAWPRHVTNAF